jgi:hypothetical protein
MLHEEKNAINRNGIKGIANALHKKYLGRENYQIN